MQIDFQKVMAHKSNEELLRVINAPPDDYLPEAISAAKTELSRRNLTDDEIQQAEEWNRISKHDEKIRSEQPLETHWKVLTFILPGVVQLALSGALLSDGFDRKAQELKKWTFKGFLFYLIIFALFFVVVILAAIFS